MSKISKANKKKRLKEYLERLKLIRKHDHVNYHESEDDKSARIERCKTDYQYFVNYYFPHYATSPCADFHVTIANKVKSNQRLRAAIEMFRGAAKSTHLDIFIPTWLHLIHGEEMFMVLVSQSESHAKRLLNDIRAEFEANAQLTHDFGDLKGHGNWEEGEFSTTTGASFLARGKKSPARGLRKGNIRPTYIVLDDIDDDEEVKNPRRVKESVKRIKRAVRLSQDIGIARFIICNNRIAPKCILTAFVENKKYWHLKINALDEFGEPTWHQKYTREYYEDLKEELGLIDFNTELMNDPTTEGEIFKEAYFQPTKLKRLNQYDRIVGFWDVAYSESETADFNAVPVVGIKGRQKHIIAFFCKQCTPEEAIRWMIEFDMQLPKTVDVEWHAESQFYNDTLLNSLFLVKAEDEFINHNFDLIWEDNPSTNKYSRIIKMLPSWQRKEYHYNQQLKDDLMWQEAEKQIKGIEPGYKTKDDAPDALQQADDLLQVDTVLSGNEAEIGKLSPSDKAF